MPSRSPRLPRRKDCLPSHRDHIAVSLSSSRFTLAGTAMLWYPGHIAPTVLLLPPRCPRCARAVHSASRCAIVPPGQSPYVVVLAWTWETASTTMPGRS